MCPVCIALAAAKLLGLTSAGGLGVHVVKKLIRGSDRARARQQNPDTTRSSS